MDSRYLLFAGRHDTAGGLGDLVATYDDEAVARAAFAALRLRSEPAAAWAELGVVDPRGRCAVLCWFGHGRPVPGARRARPPEPVAVGAPERPAVLAGAWRRAWRLWARPAR